MLQYKIAFFHSSKLFPTNFFMESITRTSFFFNSKVFHFRTDFFSVFSPKKFSFPIKQFINCFIGKLNFFQQLLAQPSFASIHLKGIGYKSYYSKSENKIYFNSGFNHFTCFLVPPDLMLRSRKVFFILFSQITSVFQYVTIIRNIRFPDPYRAKGFRFKNQTLKLKVGKQR